MNKKLQIFDFVSNEAAKLAMSNVSFQSVPQKVSGASKVQPARSIFKRIKEQIAMRNPKRLIGGLIFTPMKQSLVSSNQPEVMSHSYVFPSFSPQPKRCKGKNMSFEQNIFEICKRNFSGNSPGDKV